METSEFGPLHNILIIYNRANFSISLLLEIGCCIMVIIFNKGHRTVLPLVQSYVVREKMH